MLNAAMLDPVAADVVRTGMVVNAFTSTGVGDLDVDKVLAAPGVLGNQPRPTRAPPLRLVPDDDKIRRARLEETLEKAQAALAAAESVAAAAETALDDADAACRAVAGELVAARRRLAELEVEEKRAATERRRLQGERATAGSRVATARAGVDRAEHDLAQLDGGEPRSARY